MTQPRKLLVLVFAIALFSNAGLAQSPTFTLATWSGFYLNALEQAVVKPFTRETAVSVRIETHDGDLRPLFEPGAPHNWSVVEMERADLTEACGEGHVRQIAHNLVLGAAALDDFMPGTLHPCGVGSMIWSQAVAFDALALKGREPTTLDDFFDLKKYPGARGLFDGAEGNLEIALMADGVARKDVYSILRRDGGIGRALTRLDTLQGHIRFWRSGWEAETALNAGDVLMTTVYASQMLRPRSGARRPTGVMWTNQLWRATFLAVPTGSADEVDAYRFIAFATDPMRQAQLASRLRMGPSRRGGLDAVPEGIRNDLPTARRHFHDALPVDSGFWAEFGPEAEAAFDAWQRQIGNQNEK